MGKDSSIEWCDHTFNPWEGCSKVSPGCANCYAENRNARFGGGTAPNWGKGKPRRRTSAAYWRDPFKWDREAAEGLAEGVLLDKDIGRPRVFCASLADWLDDEVPIEWLADLLQLIHRTDSLDWLLLTKRPENWSTRIAVATNTIADSNPKSASWSRAWLNGTPPPNVWIGTSTEDQIRYDERIELLCDIPAVVRFLSVEPLLGPIDLGLKANLKSQRVLRWHRPVGSLVHSVIVGGESGPKARPMETAWAESLRDQCLSADVAFFMKQMGGTRKPFPAIPDALNIQQLPRHVHS